MADEERATRQKKRIAFWGDAYLNSTKESLRLAQEFAWQGDFFTAYLYLFVAFNNLYCLLASFEGGEPAKIRAAIGRIPATRIESIYGDEFERLIHRLNDGPPQELILGPDAGQQPLDGVMNMRDYFLGKKAAACLA